MQLSDKYGLSAAVARKRAGLPPLTPMRASTASGPSSLGPISIADEPGKDQVGGTDVIYNIIKGGGSSGRASVREYRR